MRLLVEGVRFLLELAGLAALAAGGWHLGPLPAARVALAVLLPLAGIAWWGLLVAPRSRRRLHDPARFLAETAYFGAAGLALAPVAGVPAGLALVVVAVVDAVALRRHPERPGLGAR